MALCLMLVLAAYGLRDMQGAAELSKGDGICKVKPGHPHHKGICDMNRNDEMVCRSQYLFCDWVPAKIIPAHCEGKPEHPHHKGICDMNRSEKMVCHSPNICSATGSQTRRFTSSEADESQTLTCSQALALTT